MKRVLHDTNIYGLSLESLNFLKYSIGLTPSKAFKASEWDLNTFGVYKFFALKK